MLQKALTLAPKSAMVQTAWGRYLYSQRQFDKVEAAFKKAIELDPKAIPPRIDLGDLYMTALRKPTKAIEAYRAALALIPSMPVYTMP